MEWGSALGSAVGGAFGLISTNMNNRAAENREKKARYENYTYGEMQAKNADERTRALYNDLMSPASLRKQYEEAGLSPSMMFGGSAIGGQTQAGAQGASAAVSPTTYGFSALEAAQIGLTLAQAAKVKEETKNVAEDTKSKELQNEVQELENSKYKTEFYISTTIFDVNGTETSISDIANNCNTAEMFIKRVDELANESGHSGLMHDVKTEYGQQTLRNIYSINRDFAKDIQVFKKEETDAQFQTKIIQELNKNDYSTYNAESVISGLRAAAEEATLSETQRKAWNDIIQKLQSKNSTIADIILVVGMIFDRALSNYVNVNLTRKHNVVQRFEK